MPFFLSIWGFLKGLDWKIYAAIGLVLAFWLYGNNRYHAGRDVEIARFEAAAEKAKQEAIVAAASADKNAQARVDEFEAVQDVLTQEIENAKADDRNSLDGLFGVMPATN